MDDRAQRIQRILECVDTLMHCMHPHRDSAWLTVDLTMPQLKTLIWVTRNNGSTSGQIASTLRVGLSTITGIVDRLAEQDLVTRREDPRDRRITRVIPTQRGQTLVNELLQLRNETISAIVSRLDADQLSTVESAFRYLLEAITELTNDNTTREAVA